MPIDFPSSANTGDIYTEGVYSYEYTGVKWKPINRTDYTVETSDIEVANNELVINFDLDGVQTITLSETANVVFSNPPGEGEYKKVLVDLVANTSATYDVPNPYDLESASYDNVSFSVAGQESFPCKIIFKPDGTKMYILGESTDSVRQYTLSTPWDLSTASYDNVSFSVNQDTTPLGLFFKPDGTKMYMVGESTDSVRQYTLSTPWDLSTASYDNVSFSVIAQSENPSAIFFKSDGAKMYIAGRDSNSAHQYTLSTPWDLTTASYDNVSFSIAGQESNIYGVFFKPDGTKMYIIGVDSDAVYQYTLLTAWDLSTASYDNVSFSVAGQDTNPFDIIFKPDGNKMYVIGNTTDSVYQYTTLGAVSFDSLTWPPNLEWENGETPALPDLSENMKIEIEARTDYRGTNYVARLVGRNF